MHRERAAAATQPSLAPLLQAPVTEGFDVLLRAAEPLADSACSIPSQPVGTSFTMHAYDGLRRHPTVFDACYFVDPPDQMHGIPCATNPAAFGSAVSSVAEESVATGGGGASGSSRRCVMHFQSGLPIAAYEAVEQHLKDTAVQSSSMYKALLAEYEAATAELSRFTSVLGTLMTMLANLRSSGSSEDDMGSIQQAIADARRNANSSAQEVSSLSQQLAELDRLRRTRDGTMRNVNEWRSSAQAQAVQRARARGEAVAREQATLAYGATPCSEDALCQTPEGPAVMGDDCTGGPECGGFGTRTVTQQYGGQRCQPHEVRTTVECRKPDCQYTPAVATVNMTSGPCYVRPGEWSACSKTCWTEPGEVITRTRRREHISGACSPDDIGDQVEPCSVHKCIEAPPWLPHGPYNRLCSDCQRGLIHGGSQFGNPDVMWCRACQRRGAMAGAGSNYSVNEIYLPVCRPPHRPAGFSNIDVTDDGQLVCSNLT